MPAESSLPGSSVSSSKVDLSNCDREAIHVPGSIQSFGCLIAFSDDWRVTRASANLSAYCGIEPLEALGQPMAQILDENTIHAVRTQAQLLGGPDAVNRKFDHDLGTGRPTVDLSLHRSGESYVLELERAPEAPRTVDFARVQTLVDRLKNKTRLEDLADEAVKCLRALSGFDRVMLYRFNHDHTGDVIAEAKQPQQMSYLGLRYPASDIPKQARALYLRSPLRIIADVNAATIPVLPEQDVHGAPLDLSLAIARAVSPIHLEYLRNMGVATSMSVSIVRDGKLWGLFACHNDTPRHVDFRTRTAIELFVQLANYELAQFEMASSQAQLIEMQTLHRRLMAIAADGKFTQRFSDLAEQIGKVIAFDGIAVRFGGDYLSEGAAPTADEFEELSNFLNRAGGSELFVTDALAETYPKAGEFGDRVAGILALPISRTPRDYIVLFRREIVQTVRWGGNPDKAAMQDKTTGTLHPRKSFTLWKELVKGRSSRWTEAEVRAADSVRITLLEIILKITDAAAKERARAAEQQEIIVAELNHRVRNILSLIRSLLQQSKFETNDAAFQTLSARIQSFARAHDQLTGEKPEDASLQRLFHTELAAFLADDPERLKMSGPDAILQSEAFTSLALVAHELVSNSAKYGALSVPEGRLSITTELCQDGSLALEWRERGGPRLQEPQRRGFGMTIIERTVPYQMNGRADIRFAPTGLEADFTIPATHLTKANPPTLGIVAEDEPAPRSIPERILIVEDNALISLDASEILRDAGAVHVDTAPRISAALRCLESDRFDAVLLDVNLGIETSSQVARLLVEKNVPFCLITGYSENDATLADFPKAPILRKPFSADSLIAAISALGRAP